MLGEQVVWKIFFGGVRGLRTGTDEGGRVAGGGGKGGGFVWGVDVRSEFLESAS